MAATSEPLVLAAGDLEVLLAPPIGGSMAAFRRNGVDLMRPLGGARRSVDAAMFPMVPYANRLAGNAFCFRGAEIRVEANNPPERFNVHGTGWQRPWQVTALGADFARLQLDLAAPDQPWSYRATQEFRLDPDGLSLRLTLCNTGASAMPFGFGLHPWFPRDADATLRFRADRFHPEGPEMVAGPAIALPDWARCDAGGPLPGRRLNNDFGGWDGWAEIGLPSRGAVVTLGADPVFGHLMVYADPAQDVFCVEPQSNAAGAFGRDPEGRDPREGVIVLAPGETTGGGLRFGVTAAAPASPHRPAAPIR